ncbi:MAG TPA: mercury methylation corrinoid protein HgcA [Thermodesulfobacteriota bacterium]|nr:mercury methylation corrinoid protein HgcA [Thermodesulfobacteriota bacterium]
MQEEKGLRNDRCDIGTAAGACCGKAEIQPFPMFPGSCGSVETPVSPAGVNGTVPTPRPVPKIAAEWSRADYWGMVKSRISGFRMRYGVAPGLYALGEPTRESDVFVSANYKLSFDILRRSLAGLDAWVLVLDTKNINVWCAAGKGTFGTAELLKRIAEAKLSEVVAHRRIILPQLGAVGVNASAVQKKTGFRVLYGPVDAAGIKAYVQAGYKKTREMSTVRFSFGDRLVLTPMEINPAMKKFAWVAGIMLLIFGLQPSGILFHPAWSNGLPFLILALVAVFAGAVATPVLLPYVPFRSFALKGWILGLAAVLLAINSFGVLENLGSVRTIASLLFFPAASSYLALQFTGATTFTTISGVKKELRIAIPIYIGAAAASFLLIIVFKVMEWRMA